MRRDDVTATASAAALQVTGLPKEEKFAQDGRRRGEGAAERPWQVGIARVGADEACGWAALMGGEGKGQKKARARPAR